jgi:xanthine dehydrogenase YagS FAD-binding subunit
MKEFEYVRAGNAGQAISEVAEESGARFLAGGTNLLDLMKYGVESADRLVDISHLPLHKIELLTGGGLRVGAMVRNSDLAADPHILKNFPVLSQALLAGASPQLRNMATTGGNLLQRTRCYYFYDTAFSCNKRKPGSGCSAIDGVNRIHAILGQSSNCIAVHPSDMAVALAAIDAVILVEGPQGKRSIPILEFHRLPGDHPEQDTNLDRGELILGVELPSKAVYRRSTYVKVRDRNSYAFALTSAAAALEIENGLIKDARLALGGVAHKPWRALEAEKLLIGKSPDRNAWHLCGDAALEGAKAYKYNGFKIELAKKTIARAFETIMGANA